MKINFHRDARRSREEVGGMKVPYAAAKRATPKLRWYLILAGVSAPLIILLTGLVGRSASITADGNIELQRYELRAAGSGYVKQVNVTLQSNVRERVVVIRLQDPELEATRVRLQSELDFLERGDGARAATLRQERDRRAELTLLQQAAQHQRSRRATIRELFRAGAATAAEVNEVTAAAQQAEAAVLRLQEDSRPNPPRRDSLDGERRRILADMAAL
ncbi:MAG: hypothetical protein KDI32_12380, partial [Pseudomonadales bacterium]|nr:hypothetical protein [Pseudomonadales bacterium]